MKGEARDAWERSLKALATAHQNLEQDDPDAAANRAYYAAFYAVTALFALEGKSYPKHSGIEAAVHRDLVNTGRWPKDLGADYSILLDTRHTGDYGGPEHVTYEEAQWSIRAAGQIMDAVQEEYPDVFSR